MHTIFVNISESIQTEKHEFLFSNLRIRNNKIVNDLVTVNAKLTGLKTCADSIAELITKDEDMQNDYKIIIYAEIDEKILYRYNMITESEDDKVIQLEAARALENIIELAINEIFFARLQKQGKKPKEATIVFGEPFDRNVMPRSDDSYTSHINRELWRLLAYTEPEAFSARLAKIKSSVGADAERLAAFFGNKGFNYIAAAKNFINIALGEGWLYEDLSVRGVLETENDLDSFAGASLEETSEEREYLKSRLYELSQRMDSASEDPLIRRAEALLDTGAFGTQGKFCKFRAELTKAARSGFASDKLTASLAVQAQVLKITLSELGQRLNAGELSVQEKIDLKQKLVLPAIAEDLSGQYSQMQEDAILPCDSNAAESIRSILADMIAERLVSNYSLSAESLVDMLGKGFKAVLEDRKKIHSKEKVTSIPFEIKKSSRDAGPLEETESIYTILLYVYECACKERNGKTIRPINWERFAELLQKKYNELDAELNCVDGAYRCRFDEFDRSLLTEKSNIEKLLERSDENIRSVIARRDKNVKATESFVTAEAEEPVKAEPTVQKRTYAERLRAVCADIAATEGKLSPELEREVRLSADEYAGSKSRAMRNAYALNAMRRDARNAVSNPSDYKATLDAGLLDADKKVAALPEMGLAARRDNAATESLRREAETCLQRLENAKKVCFKGTLLSLGIIGIPYLLLQFSQFSNLYMWLFFFGTMLLTAGIFSAAYLWYRHKLTSRVEQILSTLAGYVGYEKALDYRENYYDFLLYRAPVNYFLHYHARQFEAIYAVCKKDGLNGLYVDYHIRNLRAYKEYIRSTLRALDIPLLSEGYSGERGVSRIVPEGDVYENNHVYSIVDRNEIESVFKGEG